MELVADFGVSMMGDLVELVEVEFVMRVVVVVLLTVGGLSWLLTHQQCYYIDTLCHSYHLLPMPSTT